MESILNVIKKLLGVGEDDTQFDTDIIIDINSAIAILTQLGVGPSSGFFISDNVAKWTDLVGTRIDLEFIKAFVYIKVRLLFDPPQNSFLITALEHQAAELEWRIANHEEEEVITDGTQTGSTG